MSSAKPLSELTAADLAQHPVWTLVHPADPSQVVQPHTKRGVAPLLSIVRCTFTAANGVDYPGFGMITKVALVSPVVLTADGPVSLHWRDGKPSSEELSAAYRKLRSTADGFFPVAFTVNVAVRNRPVWQSFESFTYRGSDEPTAFIR